MNGMLRQSTWMAAFLSLAICMLLALPSRAYSSLGELLKEVDLAASVEVVRADSFLGRYGRGAGAEAILTRYELLIEEAVVGREAGTTIELVLPGGSLGSRGFASSDAPLLAEGQRLFVFLDFDRPGHALVGGEQGVLILERRDKKAGRPARVTSWGGRPLTDIDDRGLIFSRQGDVVLSPDEMVDRLRTVLALGSQP